MDWHGCCRCHRFVWSSITLRQNIFGCQRRRRGVVHLIRCCGRSGIILFRLLSTPKHSSALIRVPPPRWCCCRDHLPHHRHSISSQVGGTKRTESGSFRPQRDRRRSEIIVELYVPGGTGDGVFFPLFHPPRTFPAVCHDIASSIQTFYVGPSPGPAGPLKKPALAYELLPPLPITGRLRRRTRQSNCGPR